MKNWHIEFYDIEKKEWNTFVEGAVILPLVVLCATSAWSLLEMYTVIPIDLFHNHEFNFNQGVILNYYSDFALSLLCLCFVLHNLNMTSCHWPVVYCTTARNHWILLNNGKNNLRHWQIQTKPAEGDWETQIVKLLHLILVSM